MAITRAKALVIVIGNPEVLVQDPHWGSLLRYCVEHQGYVGVPLPPLDQSNTEAAMKQLSELAMAEPEETAAAGMYVSPVAEMEDPAWREAV